MWKIKCTKCNSILNEKQVNERNGNCTECHEFKLCLKMICPICGHRLMRKEIKNVFMMWRLKQLC